MTDVSLKQAMDHLTIGVAICDRDDFHFIDANALMRQWFELDSKTEPFPFYLSESDQKRFYKAIEKKRIFRFKGRYIVSSRESCVEFHVKQVQFAGSDPVLLVQGIVNQSEHETQLLIKSHDAMIERTNALLIQEKNKVEDANRAKSAFLATISHELKTPLNAIVGFIHVLTRRMDNEDHLNIVKKVSRASSNLALIIEDILQVADMESNNKTEVNPVRTDTQSILDGARNYYALLEHKKDVEFVSELSADVPEFIFVDGKKLKQAAFHLLGNAHKFTMTGRIELKISLAGDGNVISICVKDTGIGIDEDFKVKMYNAFTQEDSSSTRKYGGTGIGLSICASTAKYMGGVIRCESEKGVGTQMTLEFPFDETDQFSLY